MMVYKISEESNTVFTLRELITAHRSSLVDLNKDEVLVQRTKIDVTLEYPGGVAVSVRLHELRPDINWTSVWSRDLSVRGNTLTYLGMEKVDIELDIDLPESDPVSIQVEESHDWVPANGVVKLIEDIGVEL